MQNNSGVQKAERNKMRRPKGERQCMQIRGGEAEGGEREREAERNEIQRTDREGTQNEYSTNTDSFTNDSDVSTHSKQAFKMSM